MKPERRQDLLVVTLVLLAAFALRLYRIESVPFRGDEAFAVRYWADSPRVVLQDLAQWEPHPLGTFLSFWAWKTVAGDSELAMRYLSLLGGMVGVAAVGALARFFLKRRMSVWLSAAYAASHPFLIWHAQDARNYALWFGTSTLAMCLFLRAVHTNRTRAWLLYTLAETIALYTFFLEVFLLPVQALYLVLSSHRQNRFHPTIRAWLAIGFLLIPWAIQGWHLQNSDYRGATEQADMNRLFTWFLPTLLTGRGYNWPWDIIVPASWFLFVGITLISARDRHHIMRWLVLWGAMPMLFLLIAATSMSVFHPRYLIAATPAFLLLTIYSLTRNMHPNNKHPRLRMGLCLGMGIFPLLSLVALGQYYWSAPQKAPNWPELATYLEARSEAGELILQAVPDPAFNYYYRGSSDEISLIPDTAVASQLQPLIAKYQTIWMVGEAPAAREALADEMQELSTDSPGDFRVTQFRRWIVTPEEIATSTETLFGDFARLKGFAIQGPDRSTLSLTVLLYWEPLAQTTTDYKVFVHLVGPQNPTTGSTLWDQDDHRPQYGFASTRSWQRGTLYRDPYHLLGEPAPALVPGTYSLQIGFYDPETGARVSVFDDQGNAIGDSFTLTSFVWPLAQ